MFEIIKVFNRSVKEMNLTTMKHDENKAWRIKFVSRRFNCHFEEDPEENQNAHDNEMVFGQKHGVIDKDWKVISIIVFLYNVRCLRTIAVRESMIVRVFLM